MPASIGNALDPGQTFNPDYGWTPAGGGSSGGGGGGGGGYTMPDVNTPAAPNPSYAKTPWDLNMDPGVILAKALYNSNQAAASKYANFNYGANSLGPVASPRPMFSGGGSSGAELASIQASVAARKENLAHNLPITIRNIINRLVGHGLGNSGDTTYLPGEAKYQNDFNVGELDRELQGAQARAADQASSQAASNAYQQAVAAWDAQNDKADRDWRLGRLGEQKQMYLDTNQSEGKQNMAQALVAAYVKATQNPDLYMTSTGDLSSLLAGILGG